MLLPALSHRPMDPCAYWSVYGSPLAANASAIGNPDASMASTPTRPNRPTNRAQLLVTDTPPGATGCLAPRDGGADPRRRRPPPADEPWRPLECLLRFRNCHQVTPTRRMIP